MPSPFHRRNRFRLLAALTLGSCHAIGLGCLQDILAIIGATFF